MSWRGVKAALRDLSLSSKVPLLQEWQALDTAGLGTVPLQRLTRYLESVGLHLSDDQTAVIDKRFGDVKRQHNIDVSRLHAALELQPPAGFVDPVTTMDTLPRPYRMVNKVVTSVVDAAWAVIKSHASQPTVDQHRATVRRCGHNVPYDECVPDGDTVTAFGMSFTGHQVVLGTADGAVVIANAHTGSAVSVHTVFGAEVAGGVRLLPAVVPAPAPDTDPAALPSAELPPAPEPAADAPPRTKKGVGFATADDDDDDDGGGGGAGGGGGGGGNNKPKPPPPRWPWEAVDRGLLIAACGSTPATGDGDAGDADETDAAAGSDGAAPAHQSETGVIHVMHYNEAVVDCMPDASHGDATAGGGGGGDTIRDEWRHMCTMQPPAAVESIAFSPDARYLSATLCDGSVAVYHLHGGVIKPPPPPPVVDEAEEAAKAAARALLGSDTDTDTDTDDEGAGKAAAGGDAASEEAAASPPPPLLQPVLVIPPPAAPSSSQPPSPTPVFVASLLHTPAKQGSGSMALPDREPEGSAAGSVRSGASRATGRSRARSAASGAGAGAGGGGGASRSGSHADPADMGPPLQLPGSDMTPVTLGVLVAWTGHSRVAKYELPLALVDPILNPMPLTAGGTNGDGDDATAAAAAAVAVPTAPIVDWLLPAPLQCAAGTPLGELLATGLTDGGVVVWDGVTGASVAVCEYHDAPVTAVAFTGDGGEYVVSGAANGGVHVYHLAGAQLPPPSPDDGTTGAASPSPSASATATAATGGAGGGGSDSGAVGPLGLVGGRRVWSPTASHPSPLLHAMRRDGLTDVLAVHAFSPLPVAVVAARQAPAAHEPSGPGLALYMYDAVHGELLGAVRPSRLEPGSGAVSPPDGDWLPVPLPSATAIAPIMRVVGSVLVASVQHRLSGEHRLFGYRLPDVLKQLLPAIGDVCGDAPDSTTMAVYAKVELPLRGSSAAVAATKQALDQLNLPDFQASMRSLGSAASPTRSVTFTLPEPPGQHIANRRMSRVGSIAPASPMSRASSFKMLRGGDGGNNGSGGGGAGGDPSTHPFGAVSSTNPAELVRALMQHSAETREVRSSRASARQETLLSFLQAVDSR